MPANNTKAPEKRPRTFGGTGHLPDKERALRREQRAAGRKQAEAMSDESGTPAPPWAAALMDKLDDLIAALKGD